ncbi:hypothetical protein EJ04DRAFT_430640 [Polyplosphaeria fusca]|uniref:Uncharacterized protein n=1 Tax=Polyplosphaeria fusca TaxID=682080 RepID=A0A9P4R6C2_9PLEO|nr:hypothetical protein EJ04DRAFT_430640 [Polyplosphaeria fusca]
MGVFDNAWKASGNLSQQIGKKVGPAAGHTKEWIVKNPKQTASIAASVLVPPIAAAAAVPIIAGVGFSATGVVAGSTAAAMQASIGNVAAGSMFAFMQSAGAGGAAAGVLQGSVWGATSAAAWGATVASFFKTSESNDNGEVETPNDGKDGGVIEEEKEKE